MRSEFSNLLLGGRRAVLCGAVAIALGVSADIASASVPAVGIKQVVVNYFVFYFTGLPGWISLSGWSKTGLPSSLGQSIIPCDSRPFRVRGAKL